MGTLRIPLGGGKYATIDAGDAPLVAGFRWRSRCIHGTWYAVAYSPDLWKERRRRDVFMHRVIVGAAPGVTIDHRDGDGLNNTRGNLREASHGENMRNAKGRVGTSRFKGVSWCSRKGRWVAQIRYDGKTRFLGYFADEDAAARAYDAAAAIGHGRFARLNFPSPGG